MVSVWYRRPGYETLLTRGVRTIHEQAWITAAFFVLGIFLAREVAGRILTGDLGFLETAAIGLAGAAATFSILRNWRLGFCFFNVWLLFEDFVRKYMGNGTALFFGKDALAALIYICLFSAVSRHKERRFRPPFLLWFPVSLFVWLGALQIFNPSSPSILYGLLGFKLDFFYVPMMFVGYALLRNREDLQKFLVGNAVLAIVISAVGMMQAVLGNSFFNPGTLAPELVDMANLEKVAPISGQVLSLPNSVFVSPGRFALYLMLSATLSIGAVGYLLLSGKGQRKPVFASIGAIAAATLFSGSRSAVVYVAFTALVLTMGLMWGASWRSRMVHKVVKILGWSSAIIVAGVSLAVMLYPAEVGSRVSFYLETLSPFSSASALHYRGVSYPMENLATAFQDPNWMLGNGIGTASLGLQYVAKLLHSSYRGIWTESGWGELILEMGILAPVLWIFWSGCLLYTCWNIARRLRQTPFFPIAFAITWFAFMLLIPLTFGGTSAYQNYINNAFLWLLVGMLFRLPEIAATPDDTAQAAPARRRFGGLRFGRMPRRMPQPLPHQPVA